MKSALQQAWDAAPELAKRWGDGEAAAKAELEALRKDAERYRWLRAETSGIADARGRQEFVFPDPHPLDNILRGSVAQHLDAAIGAAMAKERA